MSTQQVSTTQTLSYPNIPFLQKLSESIQGSFKGLIDPQHILKLLGGIGLTDDFTLAMSVGQSRLAKISEVRDLRCVRENNTLSLLAYVDQPNEEAENRIYTVYGELLDLFPNTDIDVRIIELYGRTKEEMRLLNL